MTSTSFPERIRVSIGSAIVLGLLRGKLDAKPTTIYLLTCRKEKCSANCGFCPQARTSEARADMLSRVTWPTFQKRQVVDGIERTAKDGSIKRVCVQTLNYPQVFDEVLLLVREIKSRVAVPVSVSCQPLNPEKMKRLADRLLWGWRQVYLSTSRALWLSRWKRGFSQG